MEANFLASYEHLAAALNIILKKDMEELKKTNPG
jgi:hypothetical protein